MNDILKAILENAAKGAIQQQGARRAPAPQPRQQRQQTQAADPMQAILEGILGGVQRQAVPQQQQQRPSAPAPSGGMGAIQDILGGILGGSQRSGMNQAGGIADLIGILGGGGGQGGIMGGNAGTNAIADMLAQRLGISPMIARVVVAFFVAKFMGRVAEGVQNRGQQPAQQQPDSQYDYEYTPQDNADGLDLDSILDDVDDNFALNGHFSDNGMATELAQMTGMDVKTANQALAEIAKMVGQERRAVHPVRSQQSSGLKDLLDAW